MRLSAITILLASLLHYANAREMPAAFFQYIPEGFDFLIPEAQEVLDTAPSDEVAMINLVHFFQSNGVWIPEDVIQAAFDQPAVAQHQPAQQVAHQAAGGVHDVYQHEAAYNPNDPFQNDALFEQCLRSPHQMNEFIAYIGSSSMSDEKTLRILLAALEHGNMQIFDMFCYQIKSWEAVDSPYFERLLQQLTSDVANYEYLEAVLHKRCHENLAKAVGRYVVESDPFLQQLYVEKCCSHIPARIGVKLQAANIPNELMAKWEADTQNVPFEIHSVNPDMDPKDGNTEHIMRRTTDEAEIVFLFSSSDQNVAIDYIDSAEEFSMIGETIQGPFAACFYDKLSGKVTVIKTAHATGPLIAVLHRAGDEYLLSEESDPAYKANDGGTQVLTETIKSGDLIIGIPSSLAGVAESTPQTDFLDIFQWSYNDPTQDGVWQVITSIRCVKNYPFKADVFIGLAVEEKEEQEKV